MHLFNHKLGLKKGGIAFQNIDFGFRVKHVLQRGFGLSQNVLRCLVRMIDFNIEVFHN